MTSEKKVKTFNNGKVLTFRNICYVSNVSANHNFTWLTKEESILTFSTYPPTSQEKNKDNDKPHSSLGEISLSPIERVRFSQKKSY